MSSNLTSRILSYGPEDTYRIGSEIGARLTGGEVIELVSDLGGGKTTFVKGLAHGAGSDDDVNSPSFTLTNQYSTAAFRIFHYDLYRLREAGIMRQELEELCNDPKAVVVIEWAKIVEDVLPAEHVIITIRATAENDREMLIEYPKNQEYLIPTNT